MWKRLLKIFPFNFWIIFSILMTIQTAVAKIFLNIRQEKLMLAMFQILVESPTVEAETKITYKRITLASWFLSFMIMSTIFKNGLLIITETIRKEPAIETLTDIIQSKLPIYPTLNLSFYYHSEKEIKDFDSITIRRCQNYLDCLSDIAKNQNSITTGGREILRYYTVPKYFINNGELLVHIADEAIYSFHISFLFSRGHPLYVQCSKIISYSLASGWFVNVFSRLRYEFFLKTYQKYRISSKTFTLNDFKDISILWFSGVLIACLALIGEHVWYYTRKKYCARYTFSQ